jgi:hypothetical protein
VEQGETLLHDPAQLSQAGAVFGAAAGGDRGDTQFADQGPVLVVVVAAASKSYRSRSRARWAAIPSGCR